MIAINETEEKLKASEKKVVLGTLATEMAHEIQNPLNFVNNFSEMSESLALELSQVSTHDDKNEIEKMIETAKREIKINQANKLALFI